MTRLGLLAAIAAVGLSMACGDSSGGDGAADKGSDVRAPTRLTCPSGTYVETAGPLVDISSLPADFETREEAAEAWMQSRDDATSYVMSADGQAAWILRADETATARVTFMHHRGFLVEGYRACS